MQTAKRSTSILEIVALNSPDGRYDSLFLSNYATINLLDEVARIDGVGNVAVFGAGQYAMRLWLDPQKLQARNLIPADVISAVNLQSRSTGAGQLGIPPVPDGTEFQYTINVASKLDDVSQFENIIIKADAAGGGRITRLRDVARVELGAQQYSQTFKLNGQPSAGLAIFQLPEANALDVAKRVEKRMQQLQPAFPPGMTWDVPFDTTKFVAAAIHEVYKTLIEAALLVLVVILVFLQDWRATLVPATTVPVTIIGAFAAMAAFGFSVNLTTLFAIILAIGIVVDDAIVVVEGAAKHIEHGLTPHDATVKAMQELLGPIIGITLVLMAVFVPAAFLPGLSGQMYRQFALVIAATAAISAINAMTLKPAQCALWLRPTRPPESRNVFFRGFNRVYDAAEARYAGLIGRMVAHSGLMALIVAGLVALAVYGLSRVPTAFLPIEDQGYFIIAVQLPEGASLERTTSALEDVSKRVRAIPAVDKVVAIGGLDAVNDSASLANAGIAYVILKDWSERKKGEDLLGLYLGLSARVKTLDDGIALVIPPPPIQGIGNVSGATMKVELRDGSFDYAQLQHLAQAITDRASQQSMFQVARNSFRADAPQINVTIDRVKSETLGVPLGNALDALSSYVGSSYVGQFNKFGRVFQIYVQAEAAGPPASGIAEDLDGAQHRRRHGAVGHARRYHRRQRSLAALALQSLSGGDRDRQHRARLQLGTGSERARADRQGHLASRRRLRMDGDVLPGEGDRQSDLLRLRAEPAAGLSGAGRPVRELDRAADRHRVGAAGAARHRRSAAGAERTEQPLHPDRSHPADRAVGQERHPDRRVRPRPAPQRGSRHREGGRRGRPQPLPADPHDVVRLHPGRRAAGAWARAPAPTRRNRSASPS